MDGTLVFCSDSILRFRSVSDEKTAYPMTAVQQASSSEDDPYFLLRFFNHKVIIESGTTLSNIFFALEPWEKLLTAYLDRDVAAYISEVRKPSAVTGGSLEWVAINRNTAIYRSYEYLGSDDIDDYENINAYFNRERRPTNLFSVENSCDASGYIKGDKQRYSISHNLHEIKNLPIVLDGKESVGSFIGKEERLFQDGILGVIKNEYGSVILSETSFNLREMMEAIFISGLFFHSPSASDDALEDVKQASAALTEHLEESKKGTDADDEAPAETTEEIEKAENDSDKPKKVVVLPGAFDSIGEHYEREKLMWEKVKEKSNEIEGAPVRIGQITEAVLPEERSFN